MFTSGTNVENSVITESSGNVGIGTSSPHDGLHVLTNGPTLTLEGIDHTYINLYPDGYAAGRKGWLGFGSYSFDYMTIRNEIATSGHIVLDPGSGANVGVGTTSPGEKLHVNGGNLKLTSSAKNLVVVPNWGGTNQYANIATTPGESMQLRLAANGYTGITIGTDGKVGIGTTSPDYELQVDGTFRVNHSYSGITPFVIDAYGNVGIGTAAPNYRLDVDGDLKLTGNLLTYGDIVSCGVAHLGRLEVSSWTAFGDDVFVGANLQVDSGGLATYWRNNTWQTHWTIPSDRRLKANIQPLTSALDRLALLQPVEFEWRDPQLGLGRTMGFIAQDVEQVFPSWVVEMEAPSRIAPAVEALIPEGGGIKGLAFPADYDALVVQSIKELRAENLSQKDRIAALEEELWAMKILLCADHPEVAVCNE